MSGTTEHKMSRPASDTGTRATQDGNHVTVAGLWSGRARDYFGEGTDVVATDDGMPVID